MSIQNVLFHNGATPSVATLKMELNVDGITLTSPFNTATLGQSGINTLNQLNITTPLQRIKNPTVNTQYVDINPVTGEVIVTDGTISSDLSLTDLNMTSLLPVAGSTSLIQTLTNIQGPTGGFVTINTDQTINGVKTFTSEINGTATNANNVNITSTNNTGTYYLPFVSNTGNTGLFIDNITPTLTYNPATSTLTTSQITNSSGYFYGLSKDAYPSLNPYSSGVKAVSTWTTRTSALDNTWNSVCWSPELAIFVAVSSTGSANRVMTSPDGITWTTRTSAADNSWFSVCWSAELGLFVAVSQSGIGNRIMTSPNGITWTIRTSAADNFWSSVCWSAELGLFAAVSFSGSGNRVMTSPNGITWTTRTSPADNTWNSVCWSPELAIFVAVSSTGSTNRVMTSSLAGRPPTSYNVFDSSFNSIDQNGNWTFTGTFTGNASSASTIATANDNSNTSYNLVFCAGTSATAALLIDSVTTPLTYNPGLGALTANTFVGTLSGTSSSATNLSLPTSQITAVLNGTTLSIAASSANTMVSYTVQISGGTNTISGIEFSTTRTNGFYRVGIYNSGTGDLTINAILSSTPLTTRTNLSSNLIVPTLRFAYMEIHSMNVLIGGSPFQQFFAIINLMTP